MGESIIKLQRAESRTRAAPSRSGSGAEPPAPKKPSTEETLQDSLKGSSSEQETKEFILMAILKIIEQVDKTSTNAT